MFKSYFTIALRTLRKHWQYSLMNVIGLAIGMTCCILILLYVRDERSFDRYHEHAERIYRILQTEFNDDGQAETRPRTMLGTSYTLRAEMPEIESIVSVFANPPIVMRTGDKQFLESRVYAADSSYFNVFTVTFISGDASHALDGKNSIVLTRSAAEKYFGSADPIGQPMTSEDREFFVTGVVEDVPFASHLHFDMLIRLLPYEEEHATAWLGGNHYYTYFKLRPQSDIKQFGVKLSAHAKKQRPESKNTYSLQRLTDIHLKSNYKYELEPNGDADTLDILMIIAVFVVVIAAINYVNLATAQATRRAKEVGVRKVSGAQRTALIGQFLAESLSVALLSSVTSVMLIAILIYPVNQLAETQLNLFQPDLWIALVVTTLAIGLIAGLYPSFVLSAFNPVKVLKGNLTSATSTGTWLRKVLVGFQFTLSVSLILATIVMSAQMDYVLNKDPGFDQSQVIIVNNAGRLPNRGVIEQKIEQLAGVKHVGASTTIIGKTNWTTNIRVSRSSPEKVIDFCQINYDYIDALGLTLLEGRKFSPKFPADTINTIILNETAVAQLGLQDPVGQQLIWDEGGPDTTIYAQVVGVVNDFHYASYHEKIRPFAFLIRNSFFVSEDFTSKLFVKVSGRDHQENVAQIEKIWKTAVPHRPFEYQYLDNSFRELHAAETKFETLFSWLTALAIFIAALGLFALIAFVAEQRVKEIGIRKVLGASMWSIVLLMNRDFIRLTAIAIVVASPISLYFMDTWLSTFAYRISVAWWMVALIVPLSLALVILATVYQSLKASLSNPVNSLKTE